LIPNQNVAKTDKQSITGYLSRGEKDDSDKEQFEMSNSEDEQSEQISKPV